MSVAETLAPPFDVDALFARLARRPSRITADSREIRAGDAFAAYPGTRSDGRAYVADAIGRGAALVLWEAAGFAWDARWRVANHAVAGLRQQLGAIAAAVYERFRADEKAIPDVAHVELG